MTSDGKFKIKGKKVADYDSDIEVDIGAKNAKAYEVVSKEIPEPTPHQGNIILWFNAYGVKEKSTGKYADISYTVTLNELPAGKKLFVKLPNGIEEIEPKSNGNKKIKFTLAVGDPPLGFWPGG